MVTRFRKWESEQKKQAIQNAVLAEDSKEGIAGDSVRPRQLIVAVTANGAECGECGENGFDEICPQPLTKTDICRIVSRFFQ